MAQSQSSADVAASNAYDSSKVLEAFMNRSFNELAEVSTAIQKCNQLVQDCEKAFNEIQSLTSNGRTATPEELWLFQQRQPDLSSQQSFEKDLCNITDDHRPLVITILRFNGILTTIDEIAALGMISAIKVDTLVATDDDTGNHVWRTGSGSYGTEKRPFGKLVANAWQQGWDAVSKFWVEVQGGMFQDLPNELPSPLKTLYKLPRKPDLMSVLALGEAADKFFLANDQSGQDNTTELYEHLCRLDQRFRKELGWPS